MSAARAAGSPTIRPATPADAGFVSGLAGELLAFGSPAWDDPSALVARFAGVLAATVQAPSEESAVLIAQAGAEPLGFVSLRVRRDLTGARRAHIADLAVAAHARRRGVGTALMRAAEAWARANELDLLSLDVWASNERALAFYRRLGYAPEALSLLKRPGAQPPEDGGAPAF